MKYLVGVVIAVIFVFVDAADISGEFGSSFCKWKIIDPEKDVPPKVASFVASHLTESFKADNGVRLVKIRSARSQNVDGKHYDLEVLLEFTNCLASACYDDIYDSTICPTKGIAVCFVKVYYQPWTFTMKIYEERCMGSG